MGQTKKERAPRPRSLPPAPRWLAEHKLIEDADAIGDDCVGLALLILLRDLRTWVESDPAQRRALLLSPSQDRMEILQYASEHATGIAEALHDLSAMRSAPERVTPELLSAACRRVYRWADRRSFTKVAILFAEAAARVEPSTARIANDAGRAARLARQLHRADVWYDRGARLAGRGGSRHRRDLIRALLGRANLLREQGLYDEARPLLERAARLSASTRRHRVAAETQHDLLALAVEAGTYEESEHHMIEALRHYPIHHPAVPRLVHDWSFLLVRLGLYREALPLLEAVLPQFRSLEGQMGAWGTLGLAAAGAGNRERYDKAVEHVQRLIGRTHEFAAAAHANLAQGARFWGEWDLGRSLAICAIEIAQARREGDVERGAREFLASIDAQEAPPPQAGPPAESQIEAIAKEIAGLLNARKRPSRRPVQMEDEDADGPFDPPAGSYAFNSRIPSSTRQRPLR